MSYRFQFRFQIWFLCLSVSILESISHKKAKTNKLWLVTVMLKYIFNFELFNGTNTIFIRCIFSEYECRCKCMYCFTYITFTIYSLQYNYEHFDELKRISNMFPKERMLSYCVFKTETKSRDTYRTRSADLSLFKIKLKIV